MWMFGCSSAGSKSKDETGVISDTKRTTKQSINSKKGSKDDQQRQRQIRRQHQIQTQDIRVAIDKLRHANSLALRSIDDNMRRQALTIYQSNIEVLLRALNTSSSGSQPSSNANSYVLPKDLNPEVLTQYIKQALTKAEYLKASLSSTKESTSNSSSSINITSPRSPRSQPTSPIDRSPSNRRITSSNSYSPTKKGISQQQNTISSPHLQNPLYPLISNTIHIPPKSLQPISLSQLSGLSNQKETIHQSLLQPLQHPNLYTGLRTPPPGILLYGPPGTGKTMLVKAIAYESRAHTMFFSCSSATLSSKWHGEGEKILWLLFQIARDVAPSIIFLDEIDSLLGRRGGTGNSSGNSSGGGGGSNESEVARRFKTEFMVQMDGMMTEQQSDKRLWVIGCTNTPWDIDDAILRRMEVRLYIPLPDKGARNAMLQQLLQQNVHSLSESEINSLVNQTDGYSCSDLRAIGREAAFGPLRDLNLDSNNLNGEHIQEQALRPISFQDFQNAIKVCTKSVSQGLLNRYREWEQEQSA